MIFEQHLHYISSTRTVKLGYVQIEFNLTIKTYIESIIGKHAESHKHP